MRRILYASGLAASLLGLLAVAGAQIPSTSASASGDPAVAAAQVPTSSTTSTTSTSTPVPSTTTTAPAATTTTTTTAATLPPAPVPRGALDRVWRATPGGSCLVVAEQGRVLYERSPDRPVIPASTLKLLTGLTALRQLGPDTRLRTSVMAAAPATGGVIDGDLWLVGSGDPVLGTTAWGAHFTHQPALRTPIESLADAVVAAGVHEVRGGVLGDDSWFDAVRRVPSWPASYSAEGEIGPLSALTVNDGFAAWGSHGVPFADPAAGAAQVLAGLLRARGVTITGGTGRGVRPATAIDLAGVDSPPLAEVVAAMLRESDNGTAELLLKQVGRASSGAGSTAAGLGAVRATIDGLGLPSRGIRLVDGSGLGRGNLVTCRLLVALLRRGGPDLESGLAVAAQSGTLAKRFVGTSAAGRLRAKTGSIATVSALAGHVDAAGGRRLTFAYVVNNVSSTRTVKTLQEALGDVMVHYGA